MSEWNYEKRGYLLEDFRLFHLRSALKEDTAFHYHEFHKLVGVSGAPVVGGKQSGSVLSERRAGKELCAPPGL